MTQARDRQRRALRWALILDAGFMVIELAGGVAFGSLALLADGVHQVADVVALLLSVGAFYLMERPESLRHTFGLQRSDVFAALLNGAALGAASIWIVVEASHRLAHPHAVDGGPVIAVAAFGLVAQALGAVIVGRVQGRSLNMHAAAVHLWSDAAVLVATMTAGAVIAVSGWNRADPIAAIVVGALVVVAAWQVLAATVHVLMEGTPPGLDPLALTEALVADDWVQSVHHLHVWNLASDVAALSAHVVLVGPRSLHEAQTHGEHLKTLLAEQFGIEHATLELECHDCEVQCDTG